MSIVTAILLGILEGLTEFLPVSSTGHLLLAEHFFGVHSTGKTFEVLIQLGAILAVVTIYFGRIVQLLFGLANDDGARRFALSLILAFLPAVVIGVLLHDFIKEVLFESPALICWMLVLGGFLLLAIDRMTFRPVYKDVADIPPLTALKIGFFQCLAMVPGVSRSGATIVGGMLLGSDKRTAAEFSFFLAMPTMAGAFVYDLYKNRHLLDASDMLNIGVGFAAAFVVGALVVKFALGFISRHGFSFFAWWRILVGGAGLAALYLGA